MASSDVVTPVHVHSLERVSNLPMVGAVISYGSGLYSSVKGYNSFVGSSLDKAEATAHKVVDSAKPVIQKFERPINFADNILCQGLDLVESKVPSIKSTPEELKIELGKTYEAVKSYGSSTFETQVESVKSYGSSKYEYVKESITELADKSSSTPVGQTVVRSMSTAMDLANKALDSILPPGEDEKEQSQESNLEDGVVVKVTKISNKLRNRLSHYDIFVLKRALDLLPQMNKLTSN